MAEIKDGGPAFPTTGVVIDYAISYDGMTLRDYFAAKAMAELIEKHDLDKDVARFAYQIADAMLAERERDRDAR